MPSDRRKLESIQSKLLHRSRLDPATARRLMVNPRTAGPVAKLADVQGVAMRRGGASWVSPAEFVADVLSPAAGQTVTFLRTGRGLTPASYSWAFGDGATSSLTSPTHAYAATGPYTVTLIITDFVTTVTRTRTGYIVVPATVGGGDLDWGGDSLLWGTDPLNWS